MTRLLAFLLAGRASRALRRRARCWWLLAAASTAAPGGCATLQQPPPPATTAVARLARAVDGDTIVVHASGRRLTVRLLGIDTPETVKPGTPVQCGGPRASAYDHRLVDGRTVRLVFDRERRDDYGRLLAYVHVGGTFVNAALVRDGYARPYPFRPNTAHAALLARLADRAGRLGKGLWGRC